METSKYESEETVREAEISGNHPGKKDLLAVIVLLGGLLAGSLLVDVAQLVAGQGFSKNALRKGDVFEVDGKTWVAYKEPTVKMQVLTDDSCERCNPDEAILSMRQYLPTVLAEKVDFSSPAGKALLEKTQVKSLPAFIFDSSVEKTDLYTYTQAQKIFDKKDSLFVLDTQKMGWPAGKYLNFPKVEDNAIILGNKDAKVRVIEYSDFQCPYCKLVSPVIDQMLKEYGDKIAFVYKHLPLSFHPQAENAALASECANEQGKFKEYHDKLFLEQEKWGKTQDTALFKQYAAGLRLNAQQFNSCLDSKKYLDKVKADSAEAEQFGISGTPGFFVGEEFLGGAAQYSTLKEMIDRQLGNEGNASDSSGGEQTEGDADVENNA